MQPSIVLAHFYWDFKGFVLNSEQISFGGLEPRLRVLGPFRASSAPVPLAALPSNPALARFAMQTKGKFRRNQRQAHAGFPRIRVSVQKLTSSQYWK